MNRWRSELTPLRPGMPLRDALTSERLNALQDGLLELSELLGVDSRRPLRKGRKPGGHRFQVWLHAERQKLYVSEGSVMTVTDDGRYRGVVPTIDGEPLDGVSEDGGEGEGGGGEGQERPGFDIAGLGPEKDHFLVCAISGDEAELHLISEDDDPPDGDVVHELCRLRFGQAGGGNLALKSVFYYWRSDIGGASTAAGCVPWKPKWYNRGTEESPNWVVVCNLGTINGVAAANWDQDLPVGDYETVYFVILACDVDGGGSVTEATLGLVSELPDYSELNPAAEGAPPGLVKVVLGSVCGGGSCMIFDENLILAVVERFRSSKAEAPSPGLEPFVRHYGFEIRKAGG